MALTDGIVGCWSPSVRGSGYLLPDLSGRGNHGTLTNMAGNDWVGASVRGVSGTVLDYDGSNDRVACGVNGMASMPAITMHCWAYLRSTADEMLVNLKPTNTMANMFLFSGSLHLRGGSLTAVIASSSTTNRWQNFTGTIAGTTGTLYIDGVSVATGTITAVGASPTGVDIGAFSDVGGGFFVNGQIGEVAIYKRALGATEIAELYRRGNGAIGRELTGQTRRRVYGFVPAGFRAYWVQQKSRVIGGGV